jgi:hypothetical protein
MTNGDGGENIFLFELIFDLFIIKGVNNSSSVGERPEISWPSSTPSIPNSSHPSHGLVTSLASYPPSGLAYSPTVTLPTPPPNLLPSLPVSGSVNGLNPNFNLSLNINPRLLGPAHMAHPLTSLINSLHGINNKSSPSLSVAPVTTQQQQHETSKNKPDLDQKPTGLKEKLVEPICVSKSAFHQVTPALTLDETSKSGSSSPSSTSISPTNPTHTNTGKITTAPASITTAIVNQTKTVWRPY